MNILILQGSPRANGNTAWMAEEYRKVAEAAGNKVTLVDVSHKKIAGCMSCGYCRGKGNGACVQKDDMQDLYPLLAEADVLVLAAPTIFKQAGQFGNAWRCGILPRRRWRSGTWGLAYRERTGMALFLATTEQGWS